MTDAMQRAAPSSTARLSAAVRCWRWGGQPGRWQGCASSVPGVDRRP